MEKRPALRPLVALGRRLRPQFEFLGRRLTPGGLGLELTTPAGGAVGWPVRPDRLLVGRSAATPGRRAWTGPPTTSPRTCRRAGWSTGAKAVTTLGSGWVVYPAGRPGRRSSLAARRYWMEFWALVVGMALIAFFVPEIKDLDRPPAPAGPAHLGARLRFPERSRRPLDALHLAGDHPGPQGCSRDQAAKRRDRRRHPAHRPDRPHPRLSACPLAQRRDLGMGARRFLLLRRRDRGAGDCAHPRQFPAS